MVKRLENAGIGNFEKGIYTLRNFRYLNTDISNDIFNQFCIVVSHLFLKLSTLNTTNNKGLRNFKGRQNIRMVLFTISQYCIEVWNIWVFPKSWIQWQKYLSLNSKKGSNLPPRDQDAITEPARLMWETGSLNWLHQIPWVCWIHWILVPFRETSIVVKRSVLTVLTSPLAFKW